MAKLKTEVPERSFVSSYRMRCRSVAGVPVTNLDDMPFPSAPEAPGWQLMEVQGLTELLNLVEFWGCPVTIAPPERGVEYWSLELEDGKHDETGSMLDTEYDHMNGLGTSAPDSNLDDEFPS